MSVRVLQLIINIAKTKNATFCVKQRPYLLKNMLIFKEYADKNIKPLFIYCTTKMYNWVSKVPFLIYIILVITSEILL